MSWLKLFFVVCCVFCLPAQVLANIGTVIGVKQGAEITRAGKSQVLREGMEVASGDSISTDRKGVVQLVFLDDTKVAIGPNAQMKLDVTMLRGNKKAKNFAVQALGGSFRFISGQSKKRVYSIQTPTATMAVRGTTFDMWVVPGSQSAMLVLQGRVEMCGLNGSCQATGRQCSLFATTQGGGIGRPVDEAQYESALKNGFPFIQSQERLLAPLQVDIGGCGAEAAPLPPQQSDAPEPDEPQRGEVQSAEVSAPPSEPPAPEPTATGSGNGGSVGSNSGSGVGNGGNIGGSSGSGSGNGGSIGGVGGGGAGTGGTIGGNAGGGGGGGASSGGPGGNGGGS